MIMLRQLFREENVMAIQRTPISSMGISDRLVWNPSKDGQYTAKAYQKRAKGDEGSSSRQEEEERKMWKKIWSLDIKKKIQHFIWRTCNTRISVGVNLKRRRVQVDDICKQCEEGLESVEHLFFKCAKSELV